MGGTKRVTLKEIFTTSYPTPEAQSLITGFVQCIDPDSAIEIGTQKGGSAILIGRGMKAGTTIDCYDLFEEKYPEPPHAPTHANMEDTIKRIEDAELDCRIKVHKGTYQDALKELCFDVGYVTTDLLHIDICNHADNLLPILKAMHKFVDKAIILEGGVLNRWQVKYNYKSYLPLLDESEFASHWDHITIPFNRHNAVTFMTRRTNDRSEQRRI